MSDARGRVWDHAPDSRGLVAPERAVGTGRSTTLGRDDKHRSQSPDRDPGRTLRRAARPRWIGALATLAALAVVVVLAWVARGDQDATTTLNAGAAVTPTSVASDAGAAITAAGGGASTTTPVPVQTTAVDPATVFAGTWDVTVSNVRLGPTLGVAAGVGLEVGPNGTFSLVIPPDTMLADGSRWVSGRGSTVANGTYTMPCAGTCTGTFQAGIVRDATGYRYGRDGAGHPIGSSVLCGLFADDSIGRLTIDAPAGGSPARVDAFHYTGASSVSVGTPCEGAAMVLYNVTATRSS